MRALRGNKIALIEGGSRIFSRKNTKVLIKLAKQANRTKEDSDYKKLGKTIFKFLDVQDSNEDEFVDAPIGNGMFILAAAGFIYTMLKKKEETR